MIDLEAIRERDRKAERCTECESLRDSPVHGEVEPGCLHLDEHHAFRGGYYLTDPEKDRHALLVLIGHE